MPFVVQPPLFSADCSSPFAIADPDYDEKAMLRDLRDWGWIITRCEYDDDEYVDALRETRWNLGNSRWSCFIDGGGASSGGRTLKHIWSREGKRKPHAHEEEHAYNIEEDGGHGYGDANTKPDQAYIYNDNNDMEKNTSTPNNPPALDPEIARERDFLQRIYHGEEMIRESICREEIRLQAHSQDPHQHQTPHQDLSADPYPLAQYRKKPRYGSTHEMRRTISTSKPSIYLPRYVYNPQPRLPSSPHTPRSCASTPKTRACILRCHRTREKPQQVEEDYRGEGRCTPRPSPPPPPPRISTPNPPQPPRQLRTKPLSPIPPPPYELALQYPLLFPDQHRTIEQYTRHYRPVALSSQPYALRLDCTGLGDDPYGWLEWDRRMEGVREKERVIERERRGEEKLMG